MAPTIPMEYTGRRELNKCSKRGLVDSMGKTRKVSKGYTSGFVPDYRHVVETVAESEGFGSSVRVDTEMTASDDSCAPKRKCISLNADGYDRFGVPIEVMSLSNMSRSDRRDLEMRLKTELDQVRMLQKKIASLGSNATVISPTSDLHSCSDGLKRPVMDSFLTSTNKVAAAPGKKKFPPGRYGPRTKGGAMAGRRTESSRQGLQHSNTSATLMKQCEALLNRLMGHQYAWVFNEPVDIVKLNIPDYFNVIKHPMDLGTVKKKLLSGRYSNPMGLAADVRLTFKNAMTYNPRGNDVYVMAETLNKFFEVRWKPIEKKIPVTMVDESQPSRSSVIIEPDMPSSMPRTKKQKTIYAENKVELKPVKHAMSDVDKQKLGIELETLLAELPENIIDFLKETSMNGSQVSEDEIEIDIDTLSDDTLFTLRKLLDEYLLEKQKTRAKAEPCEMEIRNDSGLSNSSVEPCKDKESADGNEDVDRIDPPTSFPPLEPEDTAKRNSKCSSSSSSGGESGSSSTDSDLGSSANSESDVKDSVPPGSAKDKIVSEVDLERKKSDLGDPDTGESLDGHAEQHSHPNSRFAEPNCREVGESAPPERQVSPEKLYRAALLIGRFADIIIKAQENTLEKGEKQDPEKLRLEKEELEIRRKEEKARLQAEAKAAKEARKRAEEEAATEDKRKRELEREAAREALQKMEKTVDINENSQFMEDLEMFRAAPDEHLQSFMEETSPEHSPNGLGSFKFQANSNPLEQLGLYMKMDDEEEEEGESKNIPDASVDTEEGEID